MGLRITRHERDCQVIGWGVFLFLFSPFFVILYELILNTIFNTHNRAGGLWNGKVGHFYKIQKGKQKKIGSVDQYYKDKEREEEREWEERSVNGNKNVWYDP